MRKLGVPVQGAVVNWGAGTGTVILVPAQRHLHWGNDAGSGTGVVTLVQYWGSDTDAGTGVMTLIWY